MSKILALRDKRAKTWEKAKAFLDEKRGEDGILSVEDTATYEKMEAEVVSLGKEIERLERQASIDAELSRPTTDPITNTPTAPGGEAQTGRAAAEYRTAFWNAMRTRDGVAPEVRNALQIGTDSEGGYLVPDEFERILISALEEENIFRQIATMVETESGERKIPVSASKGEASWVDEEGVIPESDDKFGQITLGAFKVGTMIKISEELLNDSVFNLESYITKEFARRIGSKEEEAFFSGNGTGKPTGILHNSGAGVGLTAAAPNAITFDEVCDLFYSLKAPYRKKAEFILNDSTVKELRKLKDNNGQYLWQPSIKEGTPDTLLNRPLKTSAFMPAVAASAKAILFGDFSYYWIADRQGRVFKRLNELYATTGQVGFLATQRVDGKLILPEAVKCLKMKAS